jgi:hypothetical protein
VNLPTRKAQALLAYLGLRLGQPHSRDTLAALLWGSAVTSAPGMGSAMRSSPCGRPFTA